MGENSAKKSLIHARAKRFVLALKIQNLEVCEMIFFKSQEINETILAEISPQCEERAVEN